MTNEMYESYKRNANIFGRLIDEMDVSIWNNAHPDHQYTLAEWLKRR